MPPNCDSRKNGACSSPRFLSRFVRAFNSLFWWNTKPEPWNAFDPLLVSTFSTEPAARPYSAANWLVMSRSSWMMSVLFSGCWRPVTLGSLLSCPSIMKLFDRERIPLTAKFVPAANADCPLAS